MSDWQQRYKRLLFDRPHPKVLRVTMNRPEKLNATDAIMHREIAEVTGLASASIRLLLFRARRKVARLLREKATDEGGNL